MAVMTNAYLRQRFAEDFLRVNLLEPVIWARPDDQGIESITIEIPQALMRASVKDIIIDHVVISAKDVTFWHCPSVQFQNAGIRPRKDDLIYQSDGTLWLVYKVELQTGRTRYRLTCIRV